MKVALVISGFLVSYFMTPKILDMLIKGGLIRINHRGKKIPVAAGIMFPAALTLVYLFFFLWQEIDNEPFLYLGLGSMLALAGLLDDTAGNREETGFKGHVRAMIREGRLTTGFWKAAVGGIVSFIASLQFSAYFFDIVLNTLLIALSTNFFNLLDVRPGRSLKIFFFAAGMTLLFMPSYSGGNLLWPLIGVLLAYVLYDLGEDAMMGDTGANLLGFYLGLAIVAGGTLFARMVVLIILIVLHGLSEYRSLSDYIQRNRVLNFLDHWGRREFHGWKD